MIPSRGLNTLKRIAPHLRTQTRNISIARTSLSRSRPQAARFLDARPSVKYTGAVASAQYIRYASTTPSPHLSTPPPLNIDTITLDDIDFSKSSVPVEEGIGHLKDIGLDYGWGPTAVIEWTIEHLHITAGLPWWGAIAATAVIFRLLTFPLFLRSAHCAARTSALKSVLDPIQQRVRQHQKAGNSLAASQEMQNLFAVRRQAGLRFRDQLAPPLVQMVIGFCGFRLLSAMSSLPVPGLKDGGFLWLSDLTIPDGFLVLPALLAVSTHFLFRFGGESGSADATPPGMRNIFLWVLPGGLFFITAFQSGALCVWFVASGMMSAMQASIMQSNVLRGLFGLPPIIRQASPVAAAPEVEAAQPVMGSQPYTRPRYQAPSLRRGQDDVKTMDTKLVRPVESDAMPSKKSEQKKSSILGQFKTTISGPAKKYIQEQRQKRVQMLEKEKKEQAIKDAFERRRQR